MIRVLCLNPVIDRLYYIDDFCAASKFYEIEPVTFVGGKGINIARVLSIMGEACVLYSFIGGTNGRMVQKEMESYHVVFKAFQTIGETRTTINIIDNQNRKETEITETSVHIGKEQEEEFLKTLEQDLCQGDMVICSGIPMNGMRKDIYREISHICQKHSCRCVLDATGIYLKESFPGNYYFTKPNFSELKELFGTRDESMENILSYGRKMIEMGVDNLLISMGEDGGIFLSSGQSFRAEIPKIDVVSTIGSGDSAVAGFCIGTGRGMSKEDCVRLAMACGICNAGVSKVGYVEPETVWKLYEQVSIKAIMR